MKRITVSIILFIIVCGIILLSILNNKKHENNSLTTIKVAEVAHSIFYAPQYVAINNNYFEEEGLKIELTLTPGADAVMSSLLSKDVDIGLSGSEATIYVYNGGEKDYPMTFAGLTKRDGSFIVSRKKINNFTLNDLKGKKIIGGRQGGMPEMTLEWSLKENNIDPKKDLNIDTSIAFAAMEGAFIGGEGDFVTLFEPNATSVEKKGLGYIVAYVGSLGGEVPYTSYSARKSYIKNNPELIEKFSNAINKGLKYVKENNANDIAKKIESFFPDTSLEDLTIMIDRYKKNDAWKENITINEDEWIHIEDIMISSNELKEYAPYDKLIYGKHFNKYK